MAREGTGRQLRLVFRREGWGDPVPLARLVKQIPGLTGETGKRDATRAVGAGAVEGTSNLEIPGFRGTSTKSAAKQLKL
ncbi:hypothetical protein GCM10023188_19640 [Pontibacter saemangeumensis]|uniref:Uncharacterized protein n=1 Tax=Pontibacter saemangeumensis TaxID=1084525 RepID=A0ABP8LMU3_9BACT